MRNPRIVHIETTIDKDNPNLTRRDLEIVLKAKEKHKVDLETMLTIKHCLCQVTSMPSVLFISIFYVKRYFLIGG